MAIQSFEMPENHGHLLGDVPALIVVAAALAALVRIDFFRLTYRSAAVPRSFSLGILLSASAYFRDF
jgi:hypothetical protein